VTTAISFPFIYFRRPVGIIDSPNQPIPGCEDRTRRFKFQKILSKTTILKGVDTTGFRFESVQQKKAENWQKDIPVVPPSAFRHITPRLPPCCNYPPPHVHWTYVCASMLAKKNASKRKHKEVGNSFAQLKFWYLICRRLQLCTVYRHCGILFEAAFWCVGAL
jgi:hypothetical protein